MEDDVFILTMQSLGASPLPMAFGEFYTALEQKTVDAQENPLAVIHSSRFFEVQDYLAMTGHFYSPAMLLISEIDLGQRSPPTSRPSSRKRRHWPAIMSGSSPSRRIRNWKRPSSKEGHDHYLS
jgi:hypothetical protein